MDQVTFSLSLTTLSIIILPHVYEIAFDLSVNILFTPLTKYLCVVEGHMMYMGKDKWENEKLLANGWPEDIWFHVDDLSSAHVYIRLPAVSRSL